MIGSEREVGGRREGGRAGRRERRREGDNEGERGGGRKGGREREGRRDKGVIQFRRLATRQCFRSFLQANLSPLSVQLHTVTLQTPEGSVHVREWPCTPSLTGFNARNTLT